MSINRVSRSLELIEALQVRPSARTDAVGAHAADPSGPGRAETRLDRLRKDLSVLVRAVDS